MQQHPLASLLEPVQTAAADLPWADERSWRCTSHLGMHDGVPLVDLHDLSVRLALDVVERLENAPPEQGAVILVTGRGRHTGGRSRLRDAVQSRLGEHRAAGELTFHPLGPGRLKVIFDADAARAASGGMGALFWLLVALLIVGVVAAILNRMP